MPKQFRARTNTTKRKRQTLLTAIVFAMSPMLAQTSTSAEGTLTRPPLPLNGSTGQLPGNADVKINPFCMPALVTEATPILLASGSEPSNVRLQPIGAAIGLHNIGHGPIQQSDTPAITVEAPVASEVQSNPLVDRTMDAPAHTDHAEPQDQQSSIVLLPMKQTAIAAEPPKPLLDPVVETVINEPSAAGSRISEPTVVHESIQRFVDQDVAAQTKIAAAMAAPADASVEIAAESDNSEPVFFSFSDDGDSDLRQDVVSQKQEANLLETELAKGTIETPCNDDEQATTCVEADEFQPLALNEMAEAKPIEASMNDGFGSPKTNHFVIGSEPVAGNVVGSVVAGPEPTLHSRRYRPPVDVQPVPIAMERSSKNDTHSQIDSVVVSAPNLLSGAEASKPVVTSLFMNRAQVRSLTLGAELHSVKIGDKSVCQAFAAGPNQIKLIGTGNGTTRLVVYAKPTEGNTKPLARSFDIHVKDAVETTGAPTMDRPDMLNQTIQQTFPDADVVVRRSGSELVVMGRCGSEDVAKKIVRLIRRTCLVPVKDELRVR